MQIPTNHYLARIPMDKIDVLNPRERNIKVFEDVMCNIRAVGLKKPITVTPRLTADGEQRYLLVCGEGRLNTFKTAGETSIPALVVEVSDEEAFVMSLVENIARRPYKPLEMLSSIRDLQVRGDDKNTIAGKVGMSPERVQGILTLLTRCEEHLLRAVEKGSVPLTAALTIVGAGEDDKELQLVLQQLYESGELRGKQLYVARRVIAGRKKLKQNGANPSVGSPEELTAAQLVRTYQTEVGRQKTMIRKSRAAQDELLFIVTAFQQLLEDGVFVGILHSTGLDSMPNYLSQRLQERSVA
ncbi:ParB/RepB/Spo0J family partition protein [Undibacterium sp.]|uniref:ParB/RepB/Spo0J family partition protein n=1 Tax=Undibacterium sp. TaxID=1914977 RepID=UPI002C8B3757|nr:ParB/RepB/Spo0J family partition protein [Undibacterium sp.]HTD02727.1 ParB/RepB/Spo0J family partition protein [Undibacterium sp.]